MAPGVRHSKSQIVGFSPACGRTCLTPARLLAPLSRLGVSAVSRRKARAWGLITQRGEPTSRQPGTGASPRYLVRTGVPWKIATRMIREGLEELEKR